MRVLVLGASGMLGHKVFEVLLGGHEVWGTTRRQSHRRLVAAGFPTSRLLVTEGLPGREELTAIVGRLEVEVVVNCIGAVKQVAAAQDPVQAIRVNSLFPHQVAEVCSSAGTRLIHVSTDCVYSGALGNYDESAPPDAVDLYGRSKLLGEVVAEPHLTVRTSIVGRELSGATGLVEWFLGQRGGTVRGYTSAYFSGLTTLALAHVLDGVIADWGDLCGLYHVASNRIDKFALLTIINSAFGCGTEIVPDDRLHIDRSLDGHRFEAATGLISPDWPDMVAQMAADAERFGYERLRHDHLLQ